MVVQQVELEPAQEAERRWRFPIGAGIVRADLEEEDRSTALDRLRDGEPVSWLPDLNGWLVTSYELAHSVLAPRSRLGATVEARENLVTSSLGTLMLTVDGESHRRLRRPFEDPFRLRSVRDRFEDPASRLSRRLLEGLAPRGSCELSADFASPFAIGFAGEMLGLVLADQGLIQSYYEAFADAMVYDGRSEPQERADAARVSLDGLLHRELDRVRRRPDSSIASAVLNDPALDLDRDEVVAQLRVILFGAIETVESVVLNTTLLLLENAEQLALVRSDPGLLPGAVDESLRRLPPVAFFERWTTSSAQLGSVSLGPGEFVGVSVVAANRDPSVFPDPLAFDIRRSNAAAHLSFGYGIHRCLGAHLARLEGTIAVRAIFDRLNGLQVAERPQVEGFTFRRPERLHLRWRT